MPRIFQRQPPHQKHPTLTELVAHWKLNEAASSSDAADAGTNNIDLTENGTPSIVDGPHMDSDTVASKGARGFNGTSEWFEEPTGTEGDWAATLQDAYGYTIAAWVKPDSGYATNGCIVAYDAFGANESDNIQCRLSILSDREIAVRWEYDAGSNETFATGQYVADNAWSHVAVVVTDDDTTHLKRMTVVYLDGEPVAVRRGQEPATGGSNAKWMIGGSYDASGDAGVTPGQLFDGSISDVAVYPFTGTPEFCRDLYARAIKDFNVSSDIKLDGTTTTGAANYDEVLEHVAVYQRVKVKLFPDQTGMLADFADVLGWVDLTTLADANWLLDIQLDDDIDAQAARASISLSTRAYGEWALGAFLTDIDTGVADLYGNPLGELLREGHEIKVEFAAMPHGSDEVDAIPFYMLHFHGIVTAAQHGPDEVRLQCLDLTQALQDQFIEPGRTGQASDDEIGIEAQYGSDVGVDIEDNLQAILDDNNPGKIPVLFADDSGAGSAVEFEVFQSNRAVSHIIGRPHFFEAGDSILTEGDFSGVTAYADVFTVASVTDEQVTTVETLGGNAAVSSLTDEWMYGAPGKHGYVGATPGRKGSVELYVPTSPAWAQRAYNVPATMSVATALEEQAAQIGWLCRYKWDDDRKAFRLTLYDPATTSSGGKLTPNLITETSDFSFSSDNKRTVGVVEYRDGSGSGDLPDGGYAKRAVYAKDVASYQRYRRKYFRMGLFNATNIDSATEAQALADVSIASMSSETADDFAVVIPYNARWDIGSTIELLGEVARSGSLGWTSSAAVAAWQESSARFYATTETYLVTGVGIRADAARGTMMTLRLRPSVSGSGGQSRKYRDLITERGRTPGEGTRGVFGASTAPDVTSDASTLYVSWPAAVRANLLSRMYSHTEVHVSTSNGFTPDATTLADAVSGMTSVIKRTLDGGLTISTATTYYVKLVHVDTAGNRITSSQTTETTP